MSFPKSAQTKGGKAPSTEAQKEAVRQAILAREIWKKAKGAITERGKSISSLNRIRPGIFKRLVKSWDGNFEENCAQVEKAIAAFECDKMRHPDRYDSLEVKRIPGNDGAGSQWLLFVVYAVYRGTNREVAPRVRFADSIRDRYHSDGTQQWEQLGFD